MKVILNNGEVFESLGVHGRTINYQGVQRDSLIFMFDPNILSVEEIVNKFDADSCMFINITDDENNTFVYENYTIRIEVGYGYKDMVISGSVSSNNTDQVVYVRMAQTTLAERTIQQQQKVIDSLVVAILEE